MTKHTFKQLDVMYLTAKTEEAYCASQLAKNVLGINKIFVTDENNKKLARRILAHRKIIRRTVDLMTDIEIAGGDMTK